MCFAGGFDQVVSKFRAINFNKERIKLAVVSTPF